MKEPRKILMALGDRSLGEAVRALPICHAIETHWPYSHLSVGYARDTQRALLEMCPQISQLVEARDLKVTGLKHLWRTIKYFVPVARAMSGYDAILLLHRKDSRWPMFLLARLSRAQVYDKLRFTGANKPPPEMFSEKVTQMMLGTGFAKGILQYLPALHIPEKYKRFAEGFLSSNRLAGSTTVFMNPYRTSHQRAWGGVEASHTLPRYFSVAKTLSECGVKVLMHERGGPDETLDKDNLRYYQEEYESRRREVEKAGVILTGKITVGQLIAMISKCDMLWGEPSGPSWVAAALGKPTVTIAPSITCSLASWLPVIKGEAGFRNAKHTVIVHEEGKPVTEGAVTRILLERLQAQPGRRPGETSDLELSKQTTVVLGGVEVAEMERAAYVRNTQKARVSDA